MIQIGSEITLVSKGKRQGYNSTWVDDLLVGDTSFLKVTKIGSKYLYGVYFHYEDDGKREDCCWEAKVLMDDYIILEGVHPDIKQKYKEYRASVNKHEEARNQQHRDLEWKYHDALNKEMDEWDKQNPRPQPIDLEKLH